MYQVEKALKDLVDVALKRGFVSYHQVNDYLPLSRRDPTRFEGAATAWLIQQEGKGWPTPSPGVAERLAQRSATLAWGGLRSVELD